MDTVSYLLLLLLSDKIFLNASRLIHIENRRHKTITNVLNTDLVLWRYINYDIILLDHPTTTY